MLTVLTLRTLWAASDLAIDGILTHPRGAWRMYGQAEDINRAARLSVLSAGLMPMPSDEVAS